MWQRWAFVSSYCGSVIQGCVKKFLHWKLVALESVIKICFIVLDIEVN